MAVEDRAKPVPEREGTELSGRLRHPAAVAARSHASALPGKRDQECVAAPQAPGPRESVAQNPLTQIPTELLLDMPRHGLAPRLPRCESALEAGCHHAEERRLLRPAAFIPSSVAGGWDQRSPLARSRRRVDFAERAFSGVGLTIAASVATWAAVVTTGWPGIEYLAKASRAAGG